MGFKELAKAFADHARRGEVKKQEQKAAIAEAKAGKTFRRTGKQLKKAEKARAKADAYRKD